MMVLNCGVPDFDTSFDGLVLLFFFGVQCDD